MSQVENSPFTHLQYFTISKVIKVLKNDYGTKQQGKSSQWGKTVRITDENWNGMYLVKTLEDGKTRSYHESELQVTSREGGESSREQLFQDLFQTLLLSKDPVLRRMKQLLLKNYDLV